MDFKKLLPILAPIVRQIWTDMLHPELLKLEGQITQQDLKIIVTALDAAVEAIIEGELKKLTEA